MYIVFFGQSGKVMKDIVERHGYGEGRTGYSKMIIKLVYQAGMIQDEKTWIVLFGKRNEAIHSYNENVAQK